MNRSLDHWRTALASAGCAPRRTGTRAWNGPCPLCGGEDRFHLSERDDRVLVGCRRCLDGAPNAVPRYRQLLQALWPPGGEPSPPPPDPPRSEPPPQTARDSAATERAQRLWAVAEPLVPGIGPAWTYLTVRRRVWPPKAVPGELDAGRTIPDRAVRELSPAAAVDARLYLPPGAASAVVYAYTERAGDIGAVQVEAVSADAEALTAWPGHEDPIKRPLRGRPAGRFLRLPARREPRAGHPVVVTEGPLDALAAAWLWRDADVLGGFSTSSLRQLAPADVAGYDRVILAGDRDRAGLAATIAGADRLPGDVEVWAGEDGQDLADHLVARLAQASPEESPSVQWARLLEG